MKTVLQSCVEDEGGPLGIGFQEQVSNRVSWTKICRQTGLELCWRW
jgi:hypothetical protein